MIDRQDEPYTVQDCGDCSASMDVPVCSTSGGCDQAALCVHGIVHNQDTSFVHPGLPPGEDGSCTEIAALGASAACVGKKCDPRGKCPTLQPRARRLCPGGRCQPSSCGSPTSESCGPEAFSPAYNRAFHELGPVEM